MTNQTIGRVIHRRLAEVPPGAEAAAAVAGVTTYFLGHLLIEPTVLSTKVELFALLVGALWLLTEVSTRLRVPARPFRITLFVMLALRGAVILSP